ncbi:MAG TPA: DUF6089 family protein [Saprospiraceae bacterium]|nr:hypothetical protein [Lewinellaceae bacterium]HPK10061.1 DUF6089 family protein [Saprospiraceae bacterium]HPQ21884.1 DUF6089 family protein [Saprospiraceae bacterium]
MLFCLGFSPLLIHGQIYFSTEIGTMSYVGDLSPLKSAISFSNPKPYFGTSIGKQLGKVVTGEFRFVFGEVTGDDSYSKDESRRIRNLSFQSNIYEYSLGLKFNINRIFLKCLDKYGISVNYDAGIGIFNFNPRTKYEGRWVDLRPLHTECQGCYDIVDYDEYELSQLNISYGFSFDIGLSSNTKLGFNYNYRFLFTDYLDDVSNKYIDGDILSERFGTLSSILADRSDEVAGGTIHTNGAMRGDPNNNDGYFTLGMKLTFVFGKSNLVQPMEIIPESIDVKE